MSVLSMHYPFRKKGQVVSDEGLVRSYGLSRSSRVNVSIRPANGRQNDGEAGPGPASPSPLTLHHTEILEHRQNLQGSFSVMS